jgi:hypothetical protein
MPNYIKFFENFSPIACHEKTKTGLLSLAILPSFRKSNYLLIFFFLPQACEAEEASQARQCQAEGRSLRCRFVPRLWQLTSLLMPLLVLRCIIGRRRCRAGVSTGMAVRGALTRLVAASRAAIAGMTRLTWCN